jgi:hypothetical protein
VLHEGPVRAGLSLEELSRERAAFIAATGWASREEAERQFHERDAAFRRAGEHDEIVLWFEHDLYDQLQLIQVLDILSALRGPPISMVCEAEYLGSMTPERAAELFALRSPVLRRHFQEAQAAWAAFRSSDPRSIDPGKPQALRFLGAALRRHLQELPWTTDGLSLLERRILRALERGPLAFPELFEAVQEDPMFLGDAVLAWHLERLAHERLLEGWGKQWRSKDWRLSGKSRSQRAPRWLGGYEVRDAKLRWDPGSGAVVS